METLPIEILTEILLHLDIKTCILIKSVSKTIMSIINDNIFWTCKINIKNGLDELKLFGNTIKMITKSLKSVILLQSLNTACCNSKYRYTISIEKASKFYYQQYCTYCYTLMKTASFDIKEGHKEHSTIINLNEYINNKYKDNSARYYDQTSNKEYIIRVRNINKRNMYIMDSEGIITSNNSDTLNFYNEDNKLYHKSEYNKILANWQKSKEYIMLEGKGRICHIYNIINVMTGQEIYQFYGSKDDIILVYPYIIHLKHDSIQRCNLLTKENITIHINEEIYSDYHIHIKIMNNNIYYIDNNKLLIYNPYLNMKKLFQLKDDQVKYFHITRELLLIIYNDHIDVYKL